MAEPLRLTWLLENTEIDTDARLAVAQAEVMAARGHRSRIVTAGDPLSWRGSSAEWIYVEDLESYDPGKDDFVVRGAWPHRLVDESLYRTGTPQEHLPPRVLVLGAAHDEVLGIDEAYGAVAHARWFHQQLDLVRVSPWAPSKEEPLDAVQEFHVSLTSAEMTRLVHSCDVLLATNHQEERLGLPATEAMASGIPCVLTSIPAFLSFGEVPDYALFAPERNAIELGERLIEMLSDAGLRDRLRTRGREVAEQWRAHLVAERLEQFFRSQRSPC
jgi:glycosyltransferase involved in cell wall biosynthesis